jgi:hypothetical protein
MIRLTRQVYCGVAAVGLALAATAHAAPATEADAGGTFVLRDERNWESAEEIALAIKAGDGRPTLIEFHFAKAFT